MCMCRTTLHTWILTYFISPDMTSLPSTWLPPCWVNCMVLQQGRCSALHKVLVSRSQLLLEPSLVNYSLVGWLMLLVIKGCVCILSPLYSSSYLTYRWYRAHDYHCYYFWPSCRGKWWRCINYCCLGCLAHPRKPTSFSSLFILRWALVSVVITL